MQKKATGGGKGGEKGGGAKGGGEKNVKKGVFSCIIETCLDILFVCHGGEAACSGTQKTASFHRVSRNLENNHSKVLLKFLSI